MKNTVVAIAVSSGQIDRLGRGFAGVRLGVGNDARPAPRAARRSARRPPAGCPVRPQRLAVVDDRDAREVVRRRRRSWSPIRASRHPTGLSPAMLAVAQAASDVHDQNSAKLAANTTARRRWPAGSGGPSPSPAGRCRRAAACPRARAGASGRRSRLKPTKSSQKCQRPSRSLSMPAGDLRKPVVERAEQRKHRAADQHVVEVRDDEEGVVHLRCRAAPTRASRRSGRRCTKMTKKPSTKSSGVRSTGRPVPERRDPAEDLHAARDRDHACSPR